MSKLGHLQDLRSLCVDISVGVHGQTKWHVYRAFAGIISIDLLRRLVITLDMTCFVQKLGHQYDPERGFRYTEASTAWDEWPGVRMLVWAASAVARQHHIDLRVFVPRYRAVQR
jgi:hypothetical protein